MVCKMITIQTPYRVSEEDRAEFEAKYGLDGAVWYFSSPEQGLLDQHGHIVIHDNREVPNEEDVPYVIHYAIPSVEGDDDSDSYDDYLLTEAVCILTDGMWSDESKKTWIRDHNMEDHEVIWYSKYPVETFDTEVPNMVYITSSFFNKDSEYIRMFNLNGLSVYYISIHD